MKELMRRMAAVRAVRRRVQRRPDVPSDVRGLPVAPHLERRVGPDRVPRGAVREQVRPDVRRAWHLRRSAGRGSPMPRLHRNEWGVRHRARVRRLGDLRRREAMRGGGQDA